MSEHCRPQTLNLGQLQAKWLAPHGKMRNVMRVVRLGQKIEDARAIHFKCPQCGPKHGLTFIFDFPDTPAHLLPQARFTVKKFPCQMNELTLLQEMHMSCGVSGRLVDGNFTFRMRM